METLFVGKNVVFLSETESTNSYAITLLKNVNLPEGTVIHTPYQTKGRGQRGSSWKSDRASNLAVSIVFKPGFLGLEKQFFLYIVAALACYDTIAQLLGEGQFDIKIKWPNDILVNNKKIAGVLIENNIVNGQLNWCIMGIGININQEDFEDLPHATSAKALLQKSLLVTNAFELLCQNTEARYLALRNGRYEQEKAFYLQHFFGLNQLFDFEINGRPVRMTVRGISNKGLLLLEDNNGRQMEFDVKQARWMFGILH